MKALSNRAMKRIVSRKYAEFRAANPEASKAELVAWLEMNKTFSRLYSSLEPQHRSRGHRAAPGKKKARRVAQASRRANR